MPLAPRCETLLLVTIALCGSSAFAALALSPTRGSSPALYPPMAPKIFYAGSHGNGKRRAPPSAAQAPVQHAALGRPTSSMRRSRSKSYFNLFGERPSVISGPLFRAARAPPGKPGAAAGSNDFGGIDVDGFGDDDGDERDPLSPSSAGPSSAGAPFNSPPFSSYSKRSKSYSAVRAQRELNWIEAGVQSLRRFLGRIPIIGGAFCMDAADDESSAVRGENLNFNLPPCECGDACPHALDDDYKPAALIWCTDCRKQMCPTCDDVAHSPYAVLHAREVHTPLADHPEQLDCYQFIEEVSG